MTDKNEGFTLIEFCVATLILMVGLLGMLQGINLAMEKSVETVLRSEAIALADDVMTKQRGYLFTAITSVSKAPYPRTVRGIQRSYSASIAVARPTSNSKKSTVIISWNYKKAAKSHSVASAISQVQTSF